MTHFKIIRQIKRTAVKSVHKGHSIEHENASSMNN